MSTASPIILLQTRTALPPKNQISVFQTQTTTPFPPMSFLPNHFFNSSSCFPQYNTHLLFLRTFLPFTICSIISVFWFFVFWFGGQDSSPFSSCILHSIFPFYSNIWKLERSFEENSQNCVFRFSAHGCHAAILLGTPGRLSLPSHSAECVRLASLHLPPRTQQTFPSHHGGPRFNICLSPFKQGTQNEFWRNECKLIKGRN